MWLYVYNNIKLLKIEINYKLLKIHSAFIMIKTF